MRRGTFCRQSEHASGECNGGGEGMCLWGGIGMMAIQYNTIYLAHAQVGQACIHYYTTSYLVCFYINIYMYVSMCVFMCMCG